MTDNICNPTTKQNGLFMNSLNLLMFAIPILGILMSFLVARSSGYALSTKRSSETFIAIVVGAYGTSKLMLSGSYVIFALSLLVSLYILSTKGNYTRTKKEAELILSFSLLVFSVTFLLNAFDIVSNW